MPDEIKQKTFAKAWQIGKKGLKHTAVFALTVLETAFEASAKEKEYEPTAHEIACGQKLPFTDEYFIPYKKR